MSGRCRGESRKERSGHSLVPIPYSAPPGHPRSPPPSVPTGSKPREGKDPEQVTQPHLAEGDLLRAQPPALNSFLVPPLLSPKSAKTNRTKWPGRPGGTDRSVLGSVGPPLSATSCLPLKVGRGVAGLGRNLWCLLFSITVCILRLILRTRQESETRRAWAHHLKAGTGG